jgi:hypothetical protein
MAPDSIDIRQLPGGFGARISSLTSVGNDKSGVAQVKRLAAWACVRQSVPRDSLLLPAAQDRPLDELYQRLNVAYGAQILPLRKGTVRLSRQPSP